MRGVRERGRFLGRGGREGGRGRFPTRGLRGIFLGMAVFVGVSNGSGKI